MKVVSLFSGIGGIELGLHQQGFATEMFCEVDEPAQRVLRHHFPDVPLIPDVTSLKSIPTCDVLSAGFPCQDLSQAGKKVGISGQRSGLVGEIHRLISRRGYRRPEWILMENVPYMLRLSRGSAMEYVIKMIEGLGYRWAYRIVDARAFGLPQRRPRVLILASRSEDPRSALLSSDAGPIKKDSRPSHIDESTTYGFYWTEGSRGVGWADEAVPPIKGGSSIGIPSPPAIWIPSRDFVGTPAIEDAERMQGFPSGWTEPALTTKRGKGARWRLVGNAVCPRVSEWLGHSMTERPAYDSSNDVEISSVPWPNAAWGERGRRWQSAASMWPEVYERQKLLDFISKPLSPLSARATLGFLKRAGQCTNVVYSPRFLASLEAHADVISTSN